jgi:hypothetical protein
VIAGRVMRALPLCLAFLMCLGLHGTSTLGTPDADAFSSDQATLIELSFDGELFVSTSPWNVRQVIEDQLLYTVGHLNGDRAVGRLDAVRLSKVRTAHVSSGTRIRYHAVLPVAWGARRSLPGSYTFRLPKRADYGGLEAFVSTYKSLCVDWGAHDVDAGSMWYYYRPNRAGCALKSTDVVDLRATVHLTRDNTAGKYPEYTEVWKDDALDVVAIFGKYEEGASTATDAGIAAYNEFVARVKLALGAGTTAVPANLPSNPGVEVPDITFTKSDGPRRITITALLVDNVGTPAAVFDARYAALSGGADLIIYNGHAGLGRNVRAMAQKGSFAAGKYLIVFVNAATSFAYVDRSLATRRAALNTDDPVGTKYLDMVTNVMPAYFVSMASASLALISSLMAPDMPKTYNQILSSIDPSQVAVVTGEEDNVYHPGPNEVPTANWAGMDDAASVSRGEEQRFETPLLSEGRYTFTMTHDPAHPGGDADLYVSIGQRPTSTAYDCRPYKSGSNEECIVSLAVGSSARIFVMVRGYAYQRSYFLLTARR